MENTELTIYSNPLTSFIPEKDLSAAAILAVIVGLLGVLAGNGQLTAEAAEILPVISAIAVPGLFAAVVAWLLANEGSVEGIPEEIMNAVPVDRINRTEEVPVLG